MSRARSGLLIAGLLSTALLAPASASARVDKTASTSLCGHPTCTTAQLRAKVKRLRLAVFRLRDERGLLRIRLRPARLMHSRPYLAREAAYWIRKREQIRPPSRSGARCGGGTRGCASTRTKVPGPIRTARTTAACRWTTGFMRTYGGDLLERYGTADHWPPAAQVAVAERAVRTRGFNPWPNTARACGVL